MSKEAKPAEGASAVKRRASHIVLLQDAEHRPAGTVLQGTDELVARLDAAGIRYRSATAHERRLGGFPD